MSSSQKESCPWIPLCPAPVVNLDESSGEQFAIAFNEKTNELYALLPGEKEMNLMQYSFEQDSWRKVNVYPPVKYTRDDRGTYTDPWRSTAFMDCERNTIFLWYPTATALVKLSLLTENGEFCALSKEIRGWNDRFSAPKGVVIGKCVHLIGSNIHCVFDAITDSLISEDTEMFEDCFMGHAMAKAQGKVLTFGGRLELEMDADFEYTEAVYEYDIALKEWTALPVKVCEYHGMGCTSILNGKYILVIGGSFVLNHWQDLVSYDLIEIYSVADQSIKTSAIKCPHEVSECHAISVRDKSKDILAANGYMRKEWKECGIADHLFPPQYILNL